MRTLLPKPRIILLRLWAVAFALGIASWACTVGIGLTLPWGMRFPVFLLRHAAVFWAVVGTATALAAWATVQWTEPLFRALRRADANSAEEAPPPSEAAVRDAFAAPSWTISLAGFAALSVTALDLTVLPLSPFPRLTRLALDLAAWSLCLGAAPLATTLFRHVLWAWLGRVRTGDIGLPAKRAMRTRFSLRAFASVGMVGAGTTAMLVGHLDDGDAAFVGVTSGWLFFGIVVTALASSAAALWAGRLGSMIGRDLRGLIDSMRVVTATPTSEGLPSGWTFATRTQPGADLASALRDLAERYAQSAAEEARARGSIEDLQKLKSRFMAYMSHDLRSPLNSIRGFSEILLRGTDGPLNPSQRESVEMVRDSGEQLLRVVSDILDSAKLEAGRLELDRRWTPSVEILTEAVTQARTLAQGADIEIATELEPGLPPVLVDRSRVVQAVVGVLGYVMQAMRGGTVRLRARVLAGGPGPERQLRVEVIDVSSAIRAEDREHLFEAFRALREPSGRRIRGLGLGLSLARGLVAEHGGELWFETHGEQGTMFCVALPIERETGKSPAPRELPTVARRR